MESNKNKKEKLLCLKIINIFFKALFMVYTKEYSEYIRNRYKNGYYIY